MCYLPLWSHTPYRDIGTNEPLKIIMIIIIIIITYTE